jgi:hypothetical protein
VYFNRSSLMFWRNISPPASVSEDGSDIFLWNHRGLLSNYMALQPRR